MARETPEKVLAEFRRNRRNRKVEEWLYLLKLHGWVLRKDAKKHYVLSCGRHTLTVTKPHGPDGVIMIGMAATILRQIDAANADKEGKEATDDE